MKKYCLFIFSLIFLFNCELEEPVQEEPSIKIIFPNNNSYVYAIVDIVAEAEDNKGIVYVEFYIDGETNSDMKDLIPPYSYDWNVINLPDSSVHTIYAKAVDTDDNISSSKMVTVTVNNQLGIPEPVQLEASISSIDSSVVLQWSLSTTEDFSYYSIYRDINSGVNINSDHLSTINKDTVIKYIDTNVLDNMTYFYAVYLVDQFGFRAKSNEVEISIPNKSPESVFLHNPTNVTDSSMLIIWEKSQVHDFKKYSLFRSLSSNPDQTSNLVFETTNINQNSYSDSGLEKGVVYYYRLAVYDTGDLFSFSPVVSQKLSALSLENLYFGTDNSLEVMTWNVQNFPRNNDITISSIARAIQSLDIDIIALQEIESSTGFSALIDSLDHYRGFRASSAYASMNLAFLYNTNSVTIDSVYEILENEWRALPRSPLVIEGYWKNNPVIVINNHYKCCGDGVIEHGNTSDEEYRRFRASELLENYIQSHFNDQNVIVVGDLNDEITDHQNNNVFQPFINQPGAYLFADMSIATGSNALWSYPSWPSHIDHILISNELFDEFNDTSSDIQTIIVDNYMSGGWNEYAVKISDHRPVAIKLYFQP